MAKKNIKTIQFFNIQPITKERLNFPRLLTCTCILAQMETHTHVPSARLNWLIVLRNQSIILLKNLKERVPYLPRKSSGYILYIIIGLAMNIIIQFFHCKILVNHTFNMVSSKLFLLYFEY